MMHPKDKHVSRSDFDRPEPVWRVDTDPVRAQREVLAWCAVGAARELGPLLFDLLEWGDDLALLERCDMAVDGIIRLLQLRISSDFEDIPWERRNAVRLALTEYGHPDCARFLAALDEADSIEQTLYVDPYDLQPDEDDDPSPPDADWRSNPREGGVGT
jgi:hypothetical protein